MYTKSIDFGNNREDVQAGRHSTESLKVELLIMRKFLDPLNCRIKKPRFFLKQICFLMNFLILFDESLSLRVLHIFVINFFN